MVKVYELRKKDHKELVQELEKFKTELSKAKVGKVAASTQVKVTKIRFIRKNIARILTVINQKTKEKAIEKYQKKKFKPLDIRRKKTRSLRRKLTAREANAKTLKEKKKLQNYPMRKFALAA